MVFFRLDFWDVGDKACAKFDHILPVSERVRTLALLFLGCIHLPPPGIVDPTGFHRKIFFGRLQLYPRVSLFESNGIIFSLLDCWLKYCTPGSLAPFCVFVVDYSCTVCTLRLRFLGQKKSFFQRSGPEPPPVSDSPQLSGARWTRVESTVFSGG